MATILTFKRNLVDLFGQCSQQQQAKAGERCDASLKKVLQMNQELEKTFSFLRNFKIKGFTNLKIEKIIVCEENDTKSISFVYLKINSRNWQKYYLDAGTGFWNNTKTKDYSKLIDTDDCKNFAFKDYTQKLDVENEIVKKIYCQPNNENCQIIIELENGKKIILRTRDSKSFDSDCEIVLE